MPISNRKLAAISVLKAREALGSRYDKSKGPLLPLGPRQNASRQDRGPPATLWTSQVTITAPPEDGVRDALRSVVEDLSDDGTSPPLQAGPVVAKWVGLKRGRFQDENIRGSANERFEALSADVTSPITTIFVHGGAFLYALPHFTFNP